MSASRFGIGMGRRTAVSVVMPYWRHCRSGSYRRRKLSRPTVANEVMTLAPAAPVERNWVDALRADGFEREEALAELYDLLLRAARFEIGRRRAALAHVRGEDIDDLAVQAADDALVAVLAKLDTYRGASRFTTWAYKFALLEAGVKVRRRAWQGHEVVLEPESWPALADPSASVHAGTEAAELLSELQRAVRDELTPHQRTVFTALALNEVPIDVLSERLGSTRGALYKTLHDARRKLRAELEAGGYMEKGRG
jgi:RNA polymerase sigma-70 factor (ECF subfamily)